MSINTLTLHGNLGDDPELKTSQGGKMFCNFSIATEDGWGENKKTNWHRCTAFGKTAEIIAKYVKKGHEVVVQGSVDYNKHDDKWYTSILVNSFSFCRNKDSQPEVTPQATEYTAPTPVGSPEQDDLPF